MPIRVPGDRVPLPLSDVRVLAVEQFGAGPWGDAAAGRPRRRDHQDRGPGHRAATSAATCRRSRRARTRSSSRRSTAARRASRSTSATRRRRDVLHDLVRACDAVYSNLRGDQPRKLGLTYDQLRGRQPARSCAVSLSGFGMTGPARLGGRLRLHDAGARGLAEPDRRARRAAHEERALARRPLGRIRVGDRDARRHLAGPPRRRRAATATSRCSRRRCTS